MRMGACVMSTEVRDQQGSQLAFTDDEGVYHCSVCMTPLQRTVTGDITDGVRQHYRTVHPERKFR